MAYQQVTLATLKTRLAERYEGVPYWSAEEARRALNEGLRIYSAATGFWRIALTLPTVPNDPFVAVPGTLVAGTEVRWNGLPLEPCSLFDLDYLFPNWRAATTAQGGVIPTRPVYWARIALNLLAIYPADAFASVGGTDSLLVNGVRQTPVLVSDPDFVDLGQEQHDLLLGYAQHVLAFKVGGQALTSTYPAWLAFLQAMAASNRRFAQSAWYRQVLGLDQERRFRPTSATVHGAIDQAVQQASGGGGQ